MTAFLRAFVFNVFFFGLTAIMGVAGLGIRAFARDHAFGFARAWVRLVLGGLRAICRIDIEVTGREHLPPGGGVLIASQHQSAFDTLVWMILVPRASYVVKQELIRVPLFGKLLVPAGMIPVDRRGGAAALRRLLQATAAAAAAGRQIVIFPEGTRVAPGHRVPLQPGIAAIAARLAVPVVPVATNSGMLWGRRAFRKQPGTIRIVIGPPIDAKAARAALLSVILDSWRALEAEGGLLVDKSVGNQQAKPRTHSCEP